MNSAIRLSLDVLRGMPLPEPGGRGKEDRGRIAVIGGCAEVPGAVMLAAESALRAGAGKLQIATTRSIAIHLGLSVPEALVIAAPETVDGHIGRLDSKTVSRLLHNDAILIGPGMSDGTCRELVDDLFTAEGAAGFVLDAGAIGVLNGSFQTRETGRPDVVVTPHAGEMAALLERRREDVEADPAAAAREAARRFGVVVVMKGAWTCIVEPSGMEWHYEGGCAGLGTSGSGDVLAGVIGGLMARGCTPAGAALWGVYLHGEAGTRLAKRIGELGFLARDISGEIPLALAAAIQ